MISNITKHALFSVVIENGPVSKQLHAFLVSKNVNSSDITTIFDFIIESLNTADFQSIAHHALSRVFTSEYLYRKQDKQGNFLLKELIQGTQREIFTRLSYMDVTSQMGVDKRYVVTLGFYQEHQLMVCGLSNDDIDCLYSL